MSQLHQLNIANISGNEWSPIFGDEFLPRLVGSIMTDPYFAIVELVANSWDAGSNKVDIILPKQEGDIFSIEDNGISMSKEQFQRRWRDLTYDRIKEQGSTIEPSFKKTPKKRKVYGKNGIGRHAMFCFCEEYFVEIKKDGILVLASVKRASGEKCFDIDIKDESSTDLTGTRIFGSASKNAFNLSEDEVLEFIGSRFIADPEFNISVNEKVVKFEDLHASSNDLKALLDNGEEIIIKRFDSEKTGRTSKQNGICYWVDQRLVGMPSWEGFDGTLLDARHTEAKRYTYIVMANILGEDKSNIKPDWSGFYSSVLVNEVKKKVSLAIKDDLRGLTKNLRERNKKAAIDANRNVIARLPLLSREHIEQFAEEIQISCPNINAKDLENAVATLAKLEKSRTGYLLLEKLSNLDTQDLDNLSGILDEWSVTDAKRVLQEIEWRLKLLIQMEHFLDTKSADELHQLQPLFDRGLWVLGYEYDSLEFASNKELSTTLRKLFKEEDVSRIRNRPDFVVIPNESSLSVYARDMAENDDRQKMSGFQSVVILELKRAKLPIGYNEIDQVKKYAREIRSRVPSTTKINCYVFGTSIDRSLDSGEIKEGNIYIYPTEYLLVIRQAQRRLFRLRDEISSFDYLSDLFSEKQGDLFENDI
jgi:hypothetical protein